MAVAPIDFCYHLLHQLQHFHTGFLQTVAFVQGVLYKLLELLFLEQEEYKQLLRPNFNRLFGPISAQVGNSSHRPIHLSVAEDGHGYLQGFASERTELHGVLQNVWVEDLFGLLDDVEGAEVDLQQVRHILEVFC